MQKALAASVCGDFWLAKNGLISCHLIAYCYIYKPTSELKQPFYFLTVMKNL